VCAACAAALLTCSGCLEVKWPDGTERPPAADPPVVTPPTLGPDGQPVEANDWYAIAAVIAGNLIVAVGAARHQAIKHGYWKQRAKRLNGHATGRAPPGDQPEAAT
jgi:hypothetical protein